MRSSGDRLASHHASVGLGVVADSIEVSAWRLAIWMDIVDGEFVRDCLDRFIAGDFGSIKQSCQLFCRQVTLHTYVGNSPSTRQIYSFLILPLDISCSIWDAFRDDLAISIKPEVSRSSRFEATVTYKRRSIVQFFFVMCIGTYGTTLVYQVLCVAHGPLSYDGIAQLDGREYLQVYQSPKDRPTDTQSWLLNRSLAVHGDGSCALPHHCFESLYLLPLVFHSE